MSQLIRSAGCGLLFGSRLMVEGTRPVEHFQGIIQESPLQAFAVALKTLAPEVARSAGLDMVPAIAWAASCIGFGLIVAGILVPVVENGLFLCWRKLRGNPRWSSVLTRQLCGNGEAVPNGLSSAPVQS